jgi:hypothetical protein
VFICVSSVTGADYKVSFRFDEIWSHESERWTTVFSSASDTFVSIGHLRVQLYKRMNMFLIRICSIELGGLTKNHIHEVEGGFRTEATDDSAGQLFLRFWLNSYWGIHLEVMIWLTLCGHVFNCEVGFSVLGLNFKFIILSVMSVYIFNIDVSIILLIIRGVQ